MKKLLNKIKALPVIMVKVKRNTKQNLDKCTIKLNCAGILKLLIHRKILVIVQYDPIILGGKAKMRDNGDGTYTMFMEGGAG